MEHLNLLQQLHKTKEFLHTKGMTAPVAGIVLGTGLHHLLSLVKEEEAVAYDAIPGFPTATVEMHKGRLVYGTLGSKKVLLMQGRVHAYEGYSLQQIVYPVRVMKALGVQHLFLSNAAGGINRSFKKGDLVLVDDHINLLSGSPLSGPNFEELGPRFPDMSEPYSPQLKERLQQKAAALGIRLQKGVYAAVHGPHLETKAEYRYLKIIGADLVGMSTVPEVIAAHHMGLPCAALSVVTDECDPDHLQPVNIQEIIAVAREADGRLSQLLYETISAL
jgi:purine-nucleoside phosphorylase